MASKKKPKELHKKRGPKGPRKQINWHSFENLCQLGVKIERMAKMLGVSEVTLRERVKDQYEGREISDVKEELTAPLLEKLFSAQIECAIQDKSVPMLIHLGKHYLDQVDKSQTEMTISGSLALTPEEKARRITDLLGQSREKADLVRKVTELSCQEEDTFDRYIQSVEFSGQAE